MQLPKITVVTVVRNAKDLLPQTIKSVSSQNYENLEFIVIDGASTDGTVQIIERFENQISSWISEQDQGIADAFNKGARLATGDAVLYLNAGDEFVSEDSLRELVNGLPKCSNLRKGIAYGDSIIVTPSGRCTHAEADHRTIAVTSNWKLCHQSALIGIDVQRQFPYDTRLSLQMDQDFWLRCLAADVQFSGVRTPVCRYLAGGISGNPMHWVTLVIEGGLVRMLNKRTPKTVSALAQLLKEAAIADAKLHLRFALGERFYVLFKRSLGIRA